MNRRPAPARRTQLPARGGRRCPTGVASIAIVFLHDPFVDSLPRPIRHAYQSAERALLKADYVHALVIGWAAHRLPGAIGRLKACLAEAEAALAAVEVELA